ncbi:MAG: fluoride efflux transporter CrcB [Chitinophagaceae bacterium]
MSSPILLVGLGGASGSVLRYLLQRTLNASYFPYGTIVVNICGCLLIGILWGILSKNNLNEVAALLLITGFCGGFTTFSAFTYESIQLLRENKFVLFFTYLFISIAGGMLATYLGYKIFS